MFDSFVTFLYLLPFLIPQIAIIWSSILFGVMICLTYRLELYAKEISILFLHTLFFAAKLEFPIADFTPYQPF